MIKNNKIEYTIKKCCLFYLKTSVHIIRHYVRKRTAILTINKGNRQDGRKIGRVYNLLKAILQKIVALNAATQRISSDAKRLCRLYLIAAALL